MPPATFRCPRVSHRRAHVQRVARRPNRRDRRPCHPPRAGGERTEIFRHARPRQCPDIYRAARPVIIHAVTKRQLLERVDFNPLAKRLFNCFEQHSGTEPAEREVWAAEYTRRPCDRERRLVSLKCSDGNTYHVVVLTLSSRKDAPSVG